MSFINECRIWIVSLLVVALCGCATTQDLSIARGDKLFREAQSSLAQGNSVEGVMLLEKALAEQPANVQYRAYLASQQEVRNNRLLVDADGKRQAGKWVEAEAIYKQVLQFDPQSQRAESGLKLLDTQQRHQRKVNQAAALFNAEDIDGAEVKLREVLAEDAMHPTARSLYERIEQKRSAEAFTSSHLKAAVKKTVTLEFKDVNLKSVFDLFSKISNINFTFDKGVRTDTKVSIFAREMTVEAALDILLTSNKLGKKVLSDNTLLIYPDSKNREYKEQGVRTFYLTNTDAKRVMGLIKTIVKTKDLYIDEKLNMVVMRDSPEAIKLAEKLVASSDLAEPEVMLEVEVLEVSLKQLEAIGIRYPTQAGVGVQGAAGVPGRLSIAELKNFNSNLGVFTISDPVLALNLLHQDSDTNLLANPHIRVKSREKAKVHIGDRIPVITTTANSTGFVSESVNYLDVGIKLDVEPTVLLNDEVSIKVLLEVSNQTDQVKSTSGTLTYSLGTRNANTVLRLRNGETQVLAGLFRDDESSSVNKVPGLSSLPIIGKLFSDRNMDRRKKEIVLLITPRVLSNIVPPDSTYSVFNAGPDTSDQNDAPNTSRGFESNSRSSFGQGSQPMAQDSVGSAITPSAATSSQPSSPYSQPQ